MGQTRTFTLFLPSCRLTHLFPPPPANHSFKKIEFQPPEAKKFFSTVRKEMALLATSLPDGIMVKTFEDRMASGLGVGRGGGYCGPRGVPVLDFILPGSEPSLLLC